MILIVLIWRFDTHIYVQTIIAYIIRISLIPLLLLIFPKYNFSDYVWKWIRCEANVNNMNAAQISQRIHDQLKVYFKKFGRLINRNLKRLMRNYIDFIRYQYLYCSLNPSFWYN